MERKITVQMISTMTAMMPMMIVLLMMTTNKVKSSVDPMVPPVSLVLIAMMIPTT